MEALFYDYVPGQSPDSISIRQLNFQFSISLKKICLLLLNNLYTIQSLSESDHQIEAAINPHGGSSHFQWTFSGSAGSAGRLYDGDGSRGSGCLPEKAHFAYQGGPLIKFLRMIDPRMNPLIYLEYKYHPSPHSTFTNGRIFLRFRSLHEISAQPGTRICDLTLFSFNPVQHRIRHHCCQQCHQNHHRKYICSNNVHIISNIQND